MITDDIGDGLREALRAAIEVVDVYSPSSLALVGSTAGRMVRDDGGEWIRKSDVLVVVENSVDAIAAAVAVGVVKEADQ